MDTLKVILMLILAVALWVLYHKIFRVVYFDAIGAILKEIVVCLVIACLIVFGGFKAIGSFFHPKAPDPDYFGTYYNLQLLEGGIFDTMLTIKESDSKDEEITVIGYAGCIGINYIQNFEVDIPLPDGNTFICYDELHDSKITIIFNPDEDTLDVVQETASDMPTPYAGKYVNNDTWEGLQDERKTAWDAALAATAPNLWIADYFGTYVSLPYDRGEDVPCLYFSLFSNSWSSQSFCLFDNLYDNFEIPYPLGNVAPGHIEYASPTGLVAFDILGISNDGRQMIEITDFPYPEYIGTYIAARDAYEIPVNETESETVPEIDEEYNEPGNGICFDDVPTYEDPQGVMVGPIPANVSWDGTYTCRSDGADGTKTITISQTSDSTLSISMYHCYADGREETFDLVAEIGTYDRGSDFASYEEEKTLYFSLKDNSTIEVSQLHIYPAIDLEFFGTYIKE
ncbi:MAG: hypothetical protein ACI4TK_00060 [Agathobacter sp.]